MPHASHFPNKHRGLYRKFNVSRVDGRDAPGGDRHGADYFILDITFDPFALQALEAYADACRADYPTLAAEIDCKVIALLQKGAEMLAVESEFVSVPGQTLANGMVVEPFEIMKYPAAKGEWDTPIALAQLKPWVGISFYEAGKAAERAGLSRVKESQALALIADIIEQDINWTGGKVGEGRLYGGLHKKSVLEPKAGDYEPSDPEERIWYQLSNGERIYHWSGNVFEWIDDDMHGNEEGLIGRKFEKDDPSITSHYPPEKNGIGWYPAAGTNWSGDALIRGGRWSSGVSAGPFRVKNAAPTNTSTSIGFRCTRKGR